MSKIITLPVFVSGAESFKQGFDESYMKKGEGGLYTLRQQAVAESGYSSTYQLFGIDGEGTETATGAKINIPKDYLVKNAELKTVIAENVPVSGFAIGDYYIDFTVNTPDDTGTESHVYLNVKDLVDSYTAGHGIEIGFGNVVNLKVDATNANGLTVGTDGLALNLVSSLTNGAMSIADKEKLDSLSYITQAESDEMIDDLFAEDAAYLISGSTFQSAIYSNLLNHGAHDLALEMTHDIPESVTKIEISTPDSPKKAYAWKDESAGKLYIGSKAPRIYANPNSSYMFKFDAYVASISLPFLDTSKVTNMEKMFFSLYDLEGTLDLRGFDVSNVTSMEHMFDMIGEGLSASEHQLVIDMRGWNTSKVTSIAWMFQNYDTNSIVSEIRGIEDFDVSNVTNMQRTFMFNPALEALDLSKWNTAKVTNMLEMFRGFNKTKTIYASESFDTSSVTNSEGMFTGASSLVGGNGTVYDAEHTDKTYARIDKDGEPGYFTEKGSTPPTPTPNIYGAEWDGTSTTRWTRTDDAASFVDPVPYVAGASNYGSPFDSLYPWSGMTKVTDETAGELVKIPKFWYKWTKIGSAMKLQIADSPVSGFYVSPAHMDRGDGRGERDFVYVGRYHCASGYKSQSGVKPLASQTRAQFRTGCHNLGSSYWMMDYATWVTIQMLYLVEFADWNSQKTIGYGCGNKSSVENMGVSDTMPYHTGTMKSNRTTYGVGTQYRWIEDLWGNVCDFIDGIYFSDTDVYAILNPANFSDTTGGTKVSTRPTSSDYIISYNISSESGYEWLIYPSEVGGWQGTYVSDYCEYNASGVVLCGGGYFMQNQSQGLFNLVGYYNASYARGWLGSRPMKLP